MVIENLKIGQMYSLPTLANLPLSITNSGEESVVVRVDPLIPQKDELRHGALPIPDLSWTTADPDSFPLAPGVTRHVELTMVIPDDEELFGRKFQVNFWSHTLPMPGHFLAYGISSRVIFSIDTKREPAGAAVSCGKSVSLLPAAITVTGVEPGRRYRLEDLLDTPLKVKNTSSERVSVEIRMLSPRSSAAGTESGCRDLTEMAAVKFSPSRMELRPGEEWIVSGEISFRKDKAARTGKLMGVIAAIVHDQTVETRIYSRLYAQVK